MSKDKKAVKIDPKKLRKAADELQTVLDLEDDDGNPVELNKGSIEEICEKIKEAAEELTAEDEISETLAEVLELLGVEVSDAEEEEGDEEDDAEEDEEAEEEESEEEEDEEEVPELSLADQVKIAKKIDDLKVIVNNNDEFKKLRKGLNDYKGLAGPRELKAKMYTILGIETAPAPKSTEPKKTSATLRICQLVCNKFEIEKEEIQKTLEKEGYATSENTIIMQMNDTKKAINCLKDLGKL